MRRLLSVRATLSTVSFTKAIPRFRWPVRTSTVFVSFFHVTVTQWLFRPFLDARSPAPDRATPHLVLRRDTAHVLEQRLVCTGERVCQCPDKPLLFGGEPRSYGYAFPRFAGSVSSFASSGGFPHASSVMMKPRPWAKISARERNRSCGTGQSRRQGHPRGGE